MKLHLAHLEHEVFAVLWLDNRHRILDFEDTLSLDHRQRSSA